MKKQEESNKKLQPWLKIGGFSSNHLLKDPSNLNFYIELIGFICQGIFGSYFSKLAFNAMNSYGFEKFSKKERVF